MTGFTDDTRAGDGSPGARAEQGVTARAEQGVTAHAEQVRADVERRETGRVRISKRVVTEERTITVPVSREVLVLEYLDADGNPIQPEDASFTDAHRPADTDPGAHADRRTDTDRRTDADLGTGAPAIRSEEVSTWVLHEEQVDVVTHTVQREKVRVFKDTVTRDRSFTVDVAREVIDVDTEPAGAEAGHVDADRRR